MISHPVPGGTKKLSHETTNPRSFDKTNQCTINYSSLFHVDQARNSHSTTTQRKTASAHTMLVRRVACDAKTHSISAKRRGRSSLIPSSRGQACLLNHWRKYGRIWPRSQRRFRWKRAGCGRGRMFLKRSECPSHSTGCCLAAGRSWEDRSKGQKGRKGQQGHLNFP